MEEFEKWLRTACFQKPTPEAYDLAKCAWAESRNMEREVCKKICEDEAERLKSLCLDSYPEGVAESLAEKIGERSNAIVSGLPRTEEK